MVRSKVIFLHPNTPPGVSYEYSPKIKSAKEATILNVSHEIEINNARTFSPSLRVEGFELHNHVMDEPVNYNSEADVENFYYPAMTAWLLWYFGEKARVYPYSHVVRRNPVISAKAPPPLRRVHVDSTETYPRRRFARLNAKAAEEFKDDRLLMVNIWRPLVEPLYDHPLALADAQSINYADFVPMDIKFPSYTGELFGLKYNPDQKWWYYPAMKKSEIILFKCYDSIRDGSARFVPHAAFADPTAPKDAPLRESIEFRAFVVLK